MPKASYGEFNGMEPGKYKGVIYQMIELGHQTDKKGKLHSKIFVNIELENKTTKAVNNFGIFRWLSKNNPPFVGLFELIGAVLKKSEPTRQELEGFDIFGLLGKTVSVTIEEVGGYANVTGIEPSDEDMKGIRPLYAFGVEDIGNSEKMAELQAENAKAYDLVLQSDEMNSAPEPDKTEWEKQAERRYPQASADTRRDDAPVDPSGEEIRFEDIEF